MQIQGRRAHFLTHTFNELSYWESLTKLDTSLIEWTSSEGVTLSWRRRIVFSEFPATQMWQTQYIRKAPRTLES